MTSSGDDATRAVPAAAVIAGRYRLDQLVGRGGTAEVWKATDTSLDRTVALKLVTVPHDASSARAADEARTLAAFSHPNLVQVFDAGVDNAGRPWVVMEYVAGDTLADALRRGPLSYQRVTEVGIAVADALAQVHAQGLVHRDVKPANVLLGTVPKLTDFGIARLVDAAKVTSTGLMIGTASYLSPEQVVGESVGPPADVYALGLVLLEGLTGIREYDGPAVEAAMARLNRAPQVPHDLPGGWTLLLQAMTARRPADRPSAAQVAAELRAMQSGATTVLPQTGAVRLPSVDATTVLPQAVVPAPVPVAVPVPAAAVKKSRATLWISLLAIVVLVAAAVVFALSQQKSPDVRQVPAVAPGTPASVRTPLEGFLTAVSS